MIGESWYKIVFFGICFLAKLMALVKLAAQDTLAQRRREILWNSLAPNTMEIIAASFSRRRKLPANLVTIYPP